MALHYSPPNFTTVHLSGSKVRDTYECAKGTRCWAKIPGGGGLPIMAYTGLTGRLCPKGVRF